MKELFQQQRLKGHDISGFRDAGHWWAEHLKHVAQLTYGCAQGTAFAPGGMTLVGEMGPELVNLPRGSQVIPNPRLGGDVHVHLNVEGSVVAERDLAQRLRQELIRTSRRTVDLGFNQGSAIPTAGPPAPAVGHAPGAESGDRVGQVVLTEAVPCPGAASVHEATYAGASQRWLASTAVLG